MIEFFIPMEKIPTTTHQQKQVTCKNGKPHFYEPPKLIDARAKYMAYLSQFAPQDKINSAIRLTVKWIFPMVKGSYNGQYKTTKPDIWLTWQGSSEWQKEPRRSYTFHHDLFPPRFSLP